MLGIVLSRRDFREHDQIVTVYTKEKGKLSLLVRGVKKIVSKNSAHLEPFSICDITVENGKEIDYLTRVQSVDYLRKTREDLGKSLVANYAMSIVDKFFAEEERDVKFFIYLESLLFALNDVEDFDNKKVLLMLDSFIVNLLYFLGFNLSSEERIANSSAFELLQILGKEDWEEIFSIDFQLYLAKKVHKLVHTWFEYFLERKVSDWAKTCIV